MVLLNEMRQSTLIEKYACFDAAAWLFISRYALMPRSELKPIDIKYNFQDSKAPYFDFISAGSDAIIVEAVAAEMAAGAICRQGPCQLWL